MNDEIVAVLFEPALYYEVTFSSGKTERFDVTTVQNLAGGCHLLATESYPKRTIDLINLHLPELRLEQIKDLA